MMNSFAEPAHTRHEPLQRQLHFALYRQYPFGDIYAILADYFFCSGFLLPPVSSSRGRKWRKNHFPLVGSYFRPFHADSLCFGSFDNVAITNTIFSSPSPISGTMLSRFMAEIPLSFLRLSLKYNTHSCAHLFSVYWRRFWFLLMRAQHIITLPIITATSSPLARALLASCKSSSRDAPLLLHAGWH